MTKKIKKVVKVFKSLDEVVFNVRGKNFTMEVRDKHLHNAGGNNDEIFDLLKLEKRSFVKKVVGYDCDDGQFPTVRNINDLNKVINALLVECDKSNGKSYKGYKTPKEVAPKFILQYEIDEDPFELFATINEVKARIKELMSSGGHSYKVYEIKKMWTPEVEKKEVITIKGL